MVAGNSGRRSHPHSRTADAGVLGGGRATGPLGAGHLLTGGFLNPTIGNVVSDLDVVSDLSVSSELCVSELDSLSSMASSSSIIQGARAMVMA